MKFVSLRVPTNTYCASLAHVAFNGGGIGAGLIGCGFSWSTFRLHAGDYGWNFGVVALQPGHILAVLLSLPDLKNVIVLFAQGSFFIIANLLRLTGFPFASLSQMVVQIFLVTFLHSGMILM